MPLLLLLPVLGALLLLLLPAMSKCCAPLADAFAAAFVPAAESARDWAAAVACGLATTGACATRVSSPG